MCLNSTFLADKSRDETTPIVSFFFFVITSMLLKTVYQRDSHEHTAGKQLKSCTLITNKKEDDRATGIGVLIQRRPDRVVTAPVSLRGTMVARALTRLATGPREGCLPASTSNRTQRPAPLREHRSNNLVLGFHLK